MKTGRAIAVFPLELLLMAHVLVLLAVALSCQLVGNACQLVRGPQ